MKRILMVLITLVLIVGFITPAFAGGKVIMGMATDVGGLGDKSFNDGAYEGLIDAEKTYGIDARVVESKQQTDYIPNLIGLTEDGAKVTFAIGFLMGDALLEAANNLPEGKFAGVDIWIDSAKAPKNVIGLLFKEQESGYLAGVVAGLMTLKYSSATKRLNNKNVVGIVLGMDIPPVERYQAGFYAGVMSVNPTCKVLSVTTGSFNDQAKGKESALAMIEQGADIIFQVAGLTGLGAINAANESGVAAIGVDVDQSNVAPEAVMTSAIKGVKKAVLMTVKSALDDKFEGGGNRVFGIKDGATGISPFHKWDEIIPVEVKKAVEKATADLKSGKVVAPASRKDAGYKG